jgi:archaeal flagellar protein FlaJ
LKYFGRKIQIASYVAGAIIFVLGLASALVLTHYRFSATYIVPTNSDSSNYFLTDELIATIIVAALVPITFISFSNYRFLKSVERNIPQFLRDVLQGTDSGLMLPKALIEASKNGHGPVSTEFGIAMTKFAFGYDFTKSVTEAGERLRHPFAPQVAVIISEAYAAGAKMHDVLSSSVHFFNNLEQYSEQRQSELKPYTQLVYISIGVFLVICLVVLSSFILPLANMHGSASPAGSAGLSGFFKTSSFAINSSGLSYYTSIFFFAAVMESLFAGMVAGKIVDSSVGAGMRHSVILVSICAAVFLFAGSFIR